MKTFGLVGLLFLVLVFGTVLVWVPSVTQGKGGELRVTFLDVGQGDAVFIETPHGRQVLIDGGKGRGVLEELGKVMSFRDREIDMVVATHPDMDHIGGLPSVFERFMVHMYLEPGVDDDGADYVALVRAVENEGLDPIIARAGMYIALDDEVQLQVLSPTGDVRMLEANRGSVVVRLVYGDTAFVLTGDAPVGIEEYLVSRRGTVLVGDVLKLGHHGSKTSTSDLFLDVVRPAYAVVSAGCENTYGHPHEEVLTRVRAHGAEVVSTCEEGTITFTSDGQKVTRHSQ